MTDEFSGSPVPSKKAELFGSSLFDIEHALGMYAFSFCTIPAEGIYDKDALVPLQSVIDTCHIYLIGYTPIVEFLRAQQRDTNLDLTFSILNKDYVVSYELSDDLVLKRDGDLQYLQDKDGNRSWPNAHELQRRLSDAVEDLTFEVKYVGQAYGQDGSRNAIDRLLKHETLQKIALKGLPAGYRLTLLLFSIQPNNQLITYINPFAKNTDESDSRIKSGVDKLYNTSESERVSLYEASLIRYFYPDFNVEFKDSFPSTNLKILQDCYKKDFSGVIAEICIDELPFRLFSAKVKPAIYHIAKHNLHKNEDRRMFFGL